MNALLLVSWLCLPIAPLNPVEEDTLASINTHFAVGVAGPNGIVSAGPEISGKLELLVIHPFVVRGGVDFKYCQTVSALFPKGNLYTMTLSADALYYRGTDHMTGYIGIGVVYAVNHFNPWPGTADSLLACESVTSVDVDQQLGYRLTLGLRYHRSYSFEIGITELYPDFVKHSAGTDGQSVRSYHTTRTGGFRVTFGYLLPLRRF